MDKNTRPTLWPIKKTSFQFSRHIVSKLSSFFRFRNARMNFVKQWLQVWLRQSNLTALRINFTSSVQATNALPFLFILIWLSAFRGVKSIPVVRKLLRLLGNLNLFFGKFALASTDINTMPPCSAGCNWGWRYVVTPKRFGRKEK